MTEKEQAERAMDTIRYNLTPGVHTFGTCRACRKNGARGAGRCAHCAEKDLAEVIGADLARKHGESPEIVHAIGAHHEDEKPETILAILVQAADALSGARPGARREMLETYVKRLSDLERIGTSFNGVTSCYAIQAGREVRVMVSSEVVSDDHSHVLAKDIARKIENEMTYPGQIRVNVIRETRATDYAK